MRPPSLIAAGCICSAVSGLEDQMCNRIIKKLHKITAIDEVRSNEAPIWLIFFSSVNNFGRSVGRKLTSSVKRLCVICHGEYYC